MDGVVRVGFREEVGLELVSIGQMEDPQTSVWF